MEILQATIQTKVMKWIKKQTIFNAIFPGDKELYITLAFRL